MKTSLHLLKDIYRKKMILLVIQIIHQLTLFSSTFIKNIFAFIFIIVGFIILLIGTAYGLNIYFEWDTFVGFLIVGGFVMVLGFIQKAISKGMVYKMVSNHISKIGIDIIDSISADEKENKNAFSKQSLSSSQLREKSKTKHNMVK